MEVGEGGNDMYWYLKQPEPKQPPEPEPTVELPRNVEATLGMLLISLTAASHDTGKAYFIEIRPVDPQHPDVYTAEGNAEEPTGWNNPNV